MNLWEEVVKKAVNVKAKASLQPLSKTREIEFKFLKSFNLSAEKYKDKAMQKYWDRDKAKSYNLFLTNSQSQTWASKKNKRY